MGAFILLCAVVQVLSLAWVRLFQPCVAAAAMPPVRFWVAVPLGLGLVLGLRLTLVRISCLVLLRRLCRRCAFGWLCLALLLRRCGLGTASRWMGLPCQCDCVGPSSCAGAYIQPPAAAVKSPEPPARNLAQTRLSNCVLLRRWLSGLWVSSDGSVLLA